MDGYKIIDLKGANISEGTVTGLWDAVNTSNKPLVFCNFLIGDSDEIQKPFFAGFGMKSEYSTGHYQYVYFLTSDPEGSLISISVKDDDTIAIETV